LHALYQLWEQTDPVLYDPVAVTLCFTERFCKMEDLHLTVDDKGMTRIGAGKPNARVATSIQREPFLEWCLGRLGISDKDFTPHRIPKTNLAKLIAAGNLPHQVHAIEDYETDIERRWWLAGKLETKNVVAGSKRACRGVLCNDFDDRMGDPKAQYTAVVFNPVPGPPMGPNTRLSFRYWLKGTGTMRVQIYSLTNGYHRKLELTGLAKDKWTDATVDMTQLRRPDGTGGPLSADERIDDIQFYIAPAAELLIDDVILYEAGDAAKENEPFPKRFLFTGGFDTGKRGDIGKGRSGDGNEWPGEFEIVANEKPRTWKCAHSVKRNAGDDRWIRLGLRGRRPMPAKVKLRFDYRLAGGEALIVRLVDRMSGSARVVELNHLNNNDWSRATADLSNQIPAGAAAEWADEIEILLPKGGELWVDDVLLYEP
jgi:hypothetical protein